MLASSVCAFKLAGWVISMVSMSRKHPVVFTVSSGKKDVLICTFFLESVKPTHKKYSITPNELRDGLPLLDLLPHLVQEDELLEMITGQTGPLFRHDISSYRKHALRRNRSGSYSKNFLTHKQSYGITEEARSTRREDSCVLPRIPSVSAKDESLCQQRVLTTSLKANEAAANQSPDRESPSSVT